MSGTTAQSRAPGPLALAGLARLAPRRIAADTAWSVTGVAATLLTPAVAAGAVDAVLAGRDPRTGLLVLAGLLAVRALAEAAGGVTRVSVTTGVAAALRRRFVATVFARGLAGPRSRDTGDLLTRMTANTSTAASGVPGVVDVAVEVAASAVGLVALTLIDWRLGAVFVVGVVPSVLLLRRMMPRVTSRYGEYLAHQGAIAARLTDAMAGRRTIRAAGTARLEVTRILGPLPDLARAGHNTWEVQRAISWQLETLLTAVRVLVLAVSGWGVAQGRISSGEFLAAALYLGFALGFVYQADTLVYLAHAAANAQRVREVFDENLAGGPAPRLDDLPPGPGALSLRGIRVVRGGRTVLDGVDLDVPPGAAVAVVGRSGAGKSTLAQVAGRLVDPDAGTVTLDGVALRDVPSDAVRREVAYAFERPTLLGDTVADALAYGLSDVEARARVEDAARVARADDFVRRLPYGFDTPLADAPLSGGELQRLGLARAVAHGGRLLVLDDATSNLDTVTEAEVTDALTTRLAGRTRLLVAHRATTAARADLVAWLDRGRIRAIGPHRELLATEPDYPAAFAADVTEEDR
jgi:ATP-binding cassette subfamily B protein